MIDETFGLLTVIGLAGRYRSHRYWLCRCNCGQMKAVHQSDLVRGVTKSCGCSNRSLSPIDYTGLVFGVLRVMGRARNKGGHRYWKVLCECGSPRVVRERDLIKGITTSCGCMRARIWRETSVLSVELRRRLNGVLVSQVDRGCNDRRDNRVMSLNWGIRADI
jgi:hypothetical protein